MADLSTQILIEIRDEIRATRTDLSSRLDDTNSRLDQTNSRLDQTNSRLDRLERRQVDTEIRLSTDIVALTGAVHDLRDTLLEDRHLRQTVDDHEQRIRALETRT
jgi:chromosome segregation ATPase